MEQISMAAREVFSYRDAEPLFKIDSLGTKWYCTASLAALTHARTYGGVSWGQAGICMEQRRVERSGREGGNGCGVFKRYPEWSRNCII